MLFIEVLALLSFLRNPTVQGAAITYMQLIERLPDLPGA